jgi:hypothetical protein
MSIDEPGQYDVMRMNMDGLIGKESITNLGRWADGRNSAVHDCHCAVLEDLSLRIHRYHGATHD